jgi:tetratricopeptide (TPR) repeat protein
MTSILRSPAHRRASARVVLFTVCFGALGACAQGGPLGTRGQPLPEPTAEQYLQVAEAAQRMGDPLRAQQYLTSALRAGADERVVIPRLLVLYVGDGQYRVAVDQCENYLRRHPDDRKVRLLLSTLYTAVGDADRAVAEYERVLSDAPNDAYAHFAMATLLHDRGGASARADEHYRAYLGLQPNGEHADEARGLLLRRVP